VRTPRLRIPLPSILACVMPPVLRDAVSGTKSMRRSENQRHVLKGAGERLAHCERRRANLPDVAEPRDLLWRKCVFEEERWNCSMRWRIRRP
jgi:hypothetical protein